MNAHIRGRFWLFSLGLILFVTMCASAWVIIPIIWARTTVDWLGDVGQHSSIAVDSWRRPHIAYYDADLGDVKYAHYDGTNWIVETIYADQDVGSYTGIAVDSSDTPHVVFYEATRKWVWYGHRYAGTWSIERIDANGVVGEYCSIALDHFDKPHVAYQDRTGPTVQQFMLKYAYRVTPHNWNVTNVRTGYLAGGFTSIDVDYQTPHIADSMGWVYHSYPSSGTWQSEVVGTTMYSQTSIEAYGTHNVHIGFRRNSSEFNYVRKSATMPWKTDRVGVGWIAADNKMVLDQAKRPHFVCTGNGVSWFRKLSTGWTSEVVDVGGIYGSGPSIAVDAANTPHIAHYGYWDSNLVYTVRVVKDNNAFNDYNGDGLSDYCVYRPSTGEWFIRHLYKGNPICFGQQWGANGLMPVPGDYNGDGAFDLAVYQESTGEWFIRSLGPVGAGYPPITFGQQWGGPGLLPVSGDFNGDGVYDLAVYQESTGNWFIRSLGPISGGNPPICFGQNWGSAGLIPMSGDYNGDGLHDLAAFDESTGNWYIRSLGPVGPGNPPICFGQNWGNSDMTPISGDFNGDNVYDLAVYEPGGREWFIRSLGPGAPLLFAEVWAFQGEYPLAGDYNGDGMDDITTYYPSSYGEWFVKSLGDLGQIAYGDQWGDTNMIPVGARTR